MPLNLLDILVDERVAIPNPVRESKYSRFNRAQCLEQFVLPADIQVRSMNCYLIDVLEIDLQKPSSGKGLIKVDCQLDVPKRSLVRSSAGCAFISNLVVRCSSSVSTPCSTSHVGNPTLK